MALTDQPQRGETDPLLEQAEKILAQRKMRAFLIDTNLLGEPGWDILVSAFIAHRKGTVCRLADIASELDLSLATTQRWVDLLTAREFLVRREVFFGISEAAESKLTMMFQAQVNVALAEANSARQWDQGVGLRNG